MCSVGDAIRLAHPTRPGNELRVNLPCRMEKRPVATVRGGPFSEDRSDRQVAHRVDDRTVDAQFDVKVVSGRPAGRTDVADHLALRDRFADLHLARAGAHVAVQRRRAVAVVDRNGVAPAADDLAGRDDRAALRGVDRHRVVGLAGRDHVRPS